MSEEQEKFTIQQIEKYRKLEDNADKKAFWELLFTNAAIVLIGLATYLSSDKINVIPKDIAIASDIVLGVLGTTLFSESIRNNIKSNHANTNAESLEDHLQYVKKA